jgi:exodeoxyribonuclease III
MRIATWNVNSLKARLEKVLWWVERTAPDVVLLQETKLNDADVPREVFAKLGYEIAHHGQGGRNGVAIASRRGLEDVAIGFGSVAAPAALRAPQSAMPSSAAGDATPLAEARMISAVCEGIRVVSLYAPNGRTVDSPFYVAKLAWFDHLRRWLDETQTPDKLLVVGGDFNVAPDDRDVWDANACHGGTHVSPPERSAFARLCDWGLVDAYRKHHEEAERYSWWDYRAGDFYKNFGMRIDHLLVSAPLAARSVASEIDREARKGKPIPSDHAPITLDLDEPGKLFDAGWASAAQRIASRRSKASKG